MSGFGTLFYKEVLRFYKVALQTLAAPMVTVLLYLLIFSHVLSAHVEAFPGVTYTAFLVPGLIMMALIQNAFANSSSSLIQSKIMGNLVFVLLTPLSAWEIYWAFVLAAVVRGFMVGFGIWVVTLPFIDLPLHNPVWVLLFAVLGAGTLGALGVVAGIWSDKFDQLAGFQNFVVVPLSFLSGVFYSLHSLPPFWLALSHFNPFFYMIDGFRYGFFGVSDVAPGRSLAVVAGTFAALTAFTLWLLDRGWKLRS